MNTIGKNINILCRQFNTFLNRELNKTNITATELMYLGSLYKQDGLTQDDLAKEYCIDKAATARTIQGMEKKGLVNRVSDDIDKRAKRVFLTPKSTEYKAIIERIQKKWIDEINLKITEKDMELFVQVLETITERAKKINQI